MLCIPVIYVLISLLFTALTVNKNDVLPDASYTTIDNFYKAKGSYSCFNSCNSWVNRGFKRFGLRACLWTPFDFGLLNKHN